MVPSTREWLARICSTRVEPERGSPTMNIGAGLGSPLPARSAKNACVEEGANARRAPLEVLDVERRIQAPQRVAARVVLEGVGVLLALFEGLAQGEMQLRRHWRCSRLSLAEQPLHGRDLGVAEVVVLEVGKAPVGLRR